MTKYPPSHKNPELISARSAAAMALNHLTERTIETIPRELIEKTNQKQRTTDLVCGTTRNRSALDFVITSFAGCPVKRISAKILNIIRVGSFELVYCPQTPVYSIVNEAVETAKKIAGQKQAAFVNAILRKIASHIENRESPLSQQTITRTLPQNTLTGCLFDSDFLPDYQKTNADYLSSAFSLPAWLIGDWLEQFTPEQTRQICFASNRRPSVYLRPNILRTTVQDLTKKLQQAGIDFQIIDDSMIQLHSPKQISSLPGFAEGLFTIQDLAAATPVKTLQPKPDWSILDLCAAPGTKTTQLAEFTADRAKIFATDIDEKRLPLIKENIERLKLKSITVFEYNELQTIVDNAGPFDCVLLDVPCSNTAVLAKRPEVRLRITKQAIQSLAKKQFDILNKAAALVKSGGKICYSTCSLQQEENNLLVKNFLESSPDFSFEKELLTLPSADPPDHDGSYAAILIKK